MELPAAVEAYLLKSFRSANREATTLISQLPGTHETALDRSIISALSKARGPTVVGDGWTVRIDTHFLGGARHWIRWEIADIGILVQLRQRGQPRWTKVALLQSKRLYADEIQQREEDERADYEIGFVRLMREHESATWLRERRTFHFTSESRYRALVIGDEQWQAIEQYRQARDVPVFYLLYNPARLLWEVDLPHEGTAPAVGSVRVGARVVSTVDLTVAVRDAGLTGTPSYAVVAEAASRSGTRGGWSLEDFVVREVLGCRQGRRADRLNDPGLESVFYRRSGPISAAVSVAVDAPDDAAL